MNDYKLPEGSVALGAPCLALQTGAVATLTARPAPPASPPRSKQPAHLVRASAARQRRDPRRAKILTQENIDAVLAFIEAHSNAPRSDEMKIVLSRYAGLRAAEIAGLTLNAVTTPDGKIGQAIWVSAGIAKGNKTRVIPMHPRIREALLRFTAAHPGVQFFAFSKRWHTIKRQNAKALKNWFSQVYRQVGLEGCSSHSGRRTFITLLARKANQHHASLRDVQAMAGHASIESTEAYIEPADDVSTLIASI